VRVGVIGVGYFGTFHAQKYAGMSTTILVGVADRCQSSAANVAKRFGTRHFTDVHGLLEAVEAVSIAVPGPAQAGLALEALHQGRHVLVEKPMATNLAEATALAAAAHASDRLLHVGYLERFNPVFRLLQPHLRRPHLIEAERSVPFTARVRDVDVVFDLMVHDIDLVLSLMGRPVCSAEASGESVVSERIDVARALLRFEGGGTARLHASRVAAGRIRHLRIHQRESTLEVDLLARALSIRPPLEGRSGERSTVKTVETQQASWKEDALEAELSDFIQRVRRGGPSTTVSAQNGLEVLRVVEQISEQIGGWTERRCPEATSWEPEVLQGAAL